MRCTPGPHLPTRVLTGHGNQNEFSEVQQGQTPADARSHYEKALKAMDAVRSKGAQKAKEVVDEDGNATKFGAKLDLQKRHLQLDTVRFAREVVELKVKRQADVAAHLTELWQAHIKYGPRSHARPSGQRRRRCIFSCFFQRVWRHADGGVLSLRYFREGLKTLERGLPDLEVLSARVDEVRPGALRL